MKINNLTADKLRKSILQLAIQGKLVKQNPDDEPASELVKKIYAEKQKLIAEGKIKKDKTESYIYKGDDNRYYEKVGKNEPVDITDDLPFDIPDSWTFIRQVNICWLDNGTKSSGEKLPYLEAKVIRGFKQPEYYNSGVKVTPKQKVILVDGENSGEIMTPPFDGYMGSTFKIFSATSEIYYKYLLLFFELNKDTYKNSKKGAAIPHLNKDLFKSLYLPLPPLAEQQRIVEKIESMEPYLAQYDKIEKQLTKLESEIKDKLKKSILQYAIQGKLVKQDPNDEPASVLLEKIKAEKEQLIKEGKIKRDKNESFIYKGDDKNYYENLPNNWLTLPLGSVLKVFSGQGINIKSNQSGLYPIYGGNGIVGYCNEYIVEPNTIIIGRVGANCGCVHYTQEKSFISDNALIVNKFTNYIIDEYLILVLKSKNLGHLSSSTAQPLISGKIIYSLPIRIPSITTQEKIILKYNKIKNII